MLSASMAAMGLTGCGSDNVDGTKTAITVNDESITLGQANFICFYFIWFFLRHSSFIVNANIFYQNFNDRNHKIFDFPIFLRHLRCI